MSDTEQTRDTTQTEDTTTTQTVTHVEERDVNQPDAAIEPDDETPDHGE